MKEFNYQASPVTQFMRNIQNKQIQLSFILKKKQKGEDYSRMSVIFNASIGGCANWVWVQVLSLTNRWWLCLWRLCDLEEMKWRWDKWGIWGVPYGLHPSGFQPSPSSPCWTERWASELPASTEWTEVPPPPPTKAFPVMNLWTLKSLPQFFPARYSVIVTRKATNKNASWHD